jgi:hypothetical protein
MVSQDNGADLPDLIGLRLAPVSLNVDQLFDPTTVKEVVTSTDTLAETEMAEEPTQIFEAHVRVGASTQNQK